MWENKRRLFTNRGMSRSGTQTVWEPEFATVVGGTVFDGLQHIWRTTDNGGDRAYLDQHYPDIVARFEAIIADVRG